MTKIKNSLIILLVLMISVNTYAFADVDESNSIIKKQESVYINVDAYGKVSKVNIYNNYFLSNVDEIKDYGEYEKIEVVSGANEPSISGDTITWNVSGDERLGYIGKAPIELSNKMPWSISIKYFLNGVETLASNLPHKSGLVKVLIKVIPNKNAPSVYQNNYMMQITSSFDMSKYTSVSSDNAIEAQVGNTKQFTFMVLPGKEKEVSMEIGTDDFSMDSITFAMVPLEGDILELVQDLVDDRQKVRNAWDTTNESLDVILNELSSSSKNIDKIVDGTDGIQQGLNSLNLNGNARIQNIQSVIDSLNNISGDFVKIDNRVTTIRDEISYIKERANELSDTLVNIKNELKNLSKNLEKNEKDIERLSERSKELGKDLTDLSKLLDDLKVSTKELSKLLGNVDDVGDIDLGSVTKNLYAIKNTTQNIANEAGEKLQSGGEDPEFYMEVISSAQSIGNSLTNVSKELSKADELLEDVNTNTSSLNKNLNNVQKDLSALSKEVASLADYSEDIPSTLKNLKLTINSLQGLIEEMTSSLSNNLSKDTVRINIQLDKIDDLINELQLLEKDAKLLNLTIQNFLKISKDDLNVLQNEMHDATQKSIEGTQDLLKNLKGISSQSQNLKNAKNNIYNIVTSDIDDIENETTIFNIDPDMSNVSFASEKNEAPEKVQIFVQSESIKEAKVLNTKDLEPEKENLSFWDKLKNIFQMIIDFFKNLFN